MIAASRLARLFLRRLAGVEWIEVVIWSTVIWLVAFAPRLPAEPISQDQAALLYAIAYGTAGMGIPERPPKIYLKPRAALMQRYCGHPCDISAALIDGDIWLDETLDMGDPLNASILLHELVHYVQFAQHGPARDCEDHRAREIQAYAIQRAALERIGIQTARPEIPDCI